MTLVVDASALVLAAVGKSDPAVALRARLVDEDCHAPHLVDAELGNVLAASPCEARSPPPRQQRYSVPHHV